MKATKLFILLLLVFVISSTMFICIYYSFWEEGRYIISKIAFAFQRDLSIIAIGILTLSSFTAFFTFNKKTNNNRALKFLSFYLLPLSLILIHCIALIIDGFSLKTKLLDASIIAIPFLLNLTVAYLFYIKSDNKQSKS
jgi:hypothetical protein